MKNRYHILLLLFTILLISPAYGQNELDSQGKKTGAWTVKYPNGKIQYEATFNSGKPVGLMKRYYEDGNISAEMLFDSTEEKCFASLFHQNNKLAARGWFIGQKKDSVWTYYSDFDEHIILREPYFNGVIQGIVESYYPDGQVAEKTTWVDNKKHGPWTIFFDTGSIRSSGNHKNGLREGEYSVYFPDGILELRGNYKDNVADGEWNLYGEDSVLKFTYKYRDGKLLNESELLDNNHDEVLRKIQDLPDPQNIIEF